MQALARNSRRAAVLTQLFPLLSAAKPHISPHLCPDIITSCSSARAFHQALLERLWGPCFPPLKLLNASIHYGDPVGLQERDLVDLLREAASLPLEPKSMESLESSGMEPTSELVFSVMEKLREEWRPALLAFKWGQKRDCIDEKACNLMVNILGSHEKFSIAWCLIRDFRRMKMDTRRAMLIMIDR